MPPPAFFSRSRVSFSSSEGMPAVRIKNEEHSQLRTSNHSDSSPTPRSRGYYAYYMRPHGPPDPAVKNPPRNGGNNRPQSQQRRPELEAPVAPQEPLYTHTAVVQVVASASHDVLLRFGNGAYQAALNEVAEKRAAAANYLEKANALEKALGFARNAYIRLIEQQRDHVCRTEVQRVSQAQSQYQTSTVAMANIPTPAPTPAVNGGTLSSSTQPPGSNHAILVMEDYGPVRQPGGLKIVTQNNNASTKYYERPSNLPPEVFWKKTDWSGKNAFFVTDSQGKVLRRLLRGIRRTARQIWTEIDKTPGRCTGKTFLKNDSAFINDYVATIEMIYPCLTLCSGHWKALQIGIRTYPHWYRRRNMAKALENSN